MHRQQRCARPDGQPRGHGDGRGQLYGERRDAEFRDLPDRGERDGAGDRRIPLPCGSGDQAGADSGSEGGENQSEGNEDPDEDSDGEGGELLTEEKNDANPNADKETLTVKPEETSEEDGGTDEEAAAKVVTDQANATSFFEKVSAPFKADGKEIQIRTPEEAIRLMQMGVNYSRRMSEMKPLREMDAMLSQHGLKDPEKLNELIDLSKGSKEAIQKYLKKHNIDPLDLDPSKGDTHTTPNYRSDPKDVAFQDAIDTTLQVEGGKELLGDINKDWDEDSKEALRENPGLFEKLLDQKDTGVYGLIQKELLHQRTMGYLAGVPFLQAYEQVGNAMQKAGVFEKKQDPKTGLAPIASGPRKAAPKPKTEQPNPNLSSSNTSRKAVEPAPTEPDYLSMSDEDFMKLGQPPG